MKKIIIIVAVLLIALGGGAGYYFFFMKNTTKQTQEQKEKSSKKKEKGEDELSEDVALSKQIVAVDGYTVNIIQDGHVVGQAFINYLVVFKKSEVFKWAQNHTFFMDDAALSKLSDFFAVADVSKPIPFSKIRDVLKSAMYTVFPKKDIAEVVVENFYVRLNEKELDDKKD